MKVIFILLSFLVLSVTSAATTDSINTVQDQTTVKVLAAGHPVFDYKFAGYDFKPYVIQLYSPSGAAILRDAVPDHKHHHGLMFAIEVENIIFWEEGPLRGRQVQRAIAVHDGVITQHLDWQAPSNTVLLCETRTIQPHAQKDVTLLTWQSRLETPSGKDAVTLTKGHHYYGLGMRFVQTMDKVATFMNSSGQLGVAPSSRRFKENIRTMEDVSDVLYALQPVTFRYKPGIDPQSTPQFGLIAEEVEKVDPALVAHDDQGRIYTVRYEAVNAMLLNEFLKEHKTVEAQSTEIQNLEKKLDELQAVVKQLAEKK